MRFQGKAFLMAVLLGSGLVGRAQEVAHTATPTVIRSETKLVLVDAVVTDKKGNYIGDLAQKSFKVYEDNKEQPITSFSYEADPASPNNNQKRYLVLFFDNASVSIGDQMKARDAAQKFVDKNTGPNKFIAVVNFSGRLQVSQNFTNDAERLKAVINGVKFSAVDTSDENGSIGAGGRATLSEAAAFGINSVLLGMRSLAKGLADVPGRKMLVMLTAGFPSDREDVRSELAATIAACNKSNVSIYPIDVRGLSIDTIMTPASGRGVIRDLPQARLLSPGGRLASFANSFFAPDQVRGGGGVAGGGSAGTGAGAGAGAGAASGAGAAGAGGARGGSTAPTMGNPGNSGIGSSPGRGAPGGTSPSNNPGRGNPGNTSPGRGGAMNPNTVNRNPNAPVSIIPIIPPNSDANRNALYMLAEGTGGFVIINTNDLLGGMEKIAREQDQYYTIGFSPSASAEGSCHTLRVKVDKGGAGVRSRSGYCNVHQKDILAGKPAETELEVLAVGQSKGKLGAPMQLPFFYASPNVARVNLTMEIPGQGFKFEKVKGKFHAEMNLLGVAYRPDGSVAAKFSDTIKQDYDNKSQVEDFAKKPLPYESQFNIATGQYNVKVVFSGGGENFGKIEKPLVIEPFDGKQFAVSSLALSKERRNTAGDAGMDAVLIEDRVPLVSLGMQVIPAAQYNFKAADSACVYLEIFDPGLTDEKPPELQVSLQIVNRKNNETKLASGILSLAKYVHAGNPMVPVVLLMPVKDLAEGSYRLDIMSMDSAGKSTVRSADFEIDSAKAPALGWDKN